jgi:hypothetical protein
VGALAFHPYRAGRCYALADSGLFRSEEGGVDWNRIWVRFHPEGEEQQQENDSSEDEAVTSSRPGDLVINPASGLLYLATPHGILTLEEGSSRWEPLPSAGFGDQEVTQLLLEPDRPGRLYAATRSGLFLYDPNAGTWQKIQDRLPAGIIQSIAFNPSERLLWVGTEKGLFRVPAPQESTAVGRASFPPDPRILSEGPSIQEVQEAAIRYAEVQPEKIQDWRRRAAWRSWLPELTLGLDRDSDRTVVSSTSGGKTTFSVGPEDRSVSLDVGLQWDLADFIWNPDQTAIDVRSRLMVQLRQEILDEVTRTYFERKRLLAEFQGNPTQDRLLTAERTCRIEELTAHLDALTGGLFSQEGARE